MMKNNVLGYNSSEEMVTGVLDRSRAARAAKGNMPNHWEDLARVMAPRRLGFTSAQPVGDQRMDNIFDGTPIHAAIGLRNAIAGLMRPDGQDWVLVKAEDENLESNDEAAAWLADSQERLMKELNNPRARFRQATGEVDLDLVVFGTAIMFIGETDELNALLFQSVSLKDASVLFGESGRAEGMFHTRQFTIRQAMARFDTERFGDGTKKKIKEGKIDDKIEVLHAIVPRAEGRAGAMLAVNLPYADMWIEVNSKRLLKEGGFNEFPYVVARWDTTSGEDYGRSPGMIALPDANTLNSMGETMLVAGQRAADPPIMAPNDGSFDAINTYPGGLGYYDVETAAQVGGNPFFPMPSGANMPLTREMQMDTREQVRAAFFRNVLNLPVEGPTMTATEVNARKEEFIREIGPVFGRLETDYTGPTVERAFQIILRHGGFMPVPDVLAGSTVRFEYESPVKRIREEIEAASAREWAMQMIALSEVRPEALDLVNVDELGRIAAETAGFAHQIVNDRDTVDAVRQQRAEQQAQEKQAAMTQQVAETASKAAPAMETMGMIPQAEA